MENKEQGKINDTLKLIWLIVVVNGGFYVLLMLPEWIDEWFK